MVDINSHLVELADHLDKDGKTVCANAVDDLIQSTSLTKVAQYVGVIGYVLKQNRAMCNCIRKKRVANSGAMQDVILECLKEYQDGQNYNDTEWTSKYAQSIVRNPDQFNKAHLALIAEMGRNDNLENHINRVRKVASVLKENDIDDDVINQVLSHIQILGDMLQKEAANARPFKVAADPGKKGKWSRFWESPANPFSSWYKKYDEENKMRGDDKEMDRELDEITDKIMSISTLSDTIKEEISHLKAKARYIPDENASKIISALDPNDWYKTQSDIDKLQKEMGTMPANSSRPINDAIRLSKKLGETKDTIAAYVADIRTTLQSLAKRGAMLGRREHRGPGQAESIATEFGMLRKVVRALGQNPLDERAHDYALHMVSRLNDILEPISTQNQKSSTDPSDKYKIHNEIEDWMKPQPTVQSPGETPLGAETTTPPTGQPPTPPKSTAPATPSAEQSTVSDEDIKTISDHIKSSVSNTSEASKIIHQLGTALLGAGLIDRRIHDSLIQIEEQLSVESTIKPGTTDAPVSGSQKPVKPVQPATSETPDDEVTEEELQRYVGAATEPALFRIADAIDKVNPNLASIIDKFIEEHGPTIDWPQMPEFSVIVKEKKE